MEDTRFSRKAVRYDQIRLGEKFRVMGAAYEKIGGTWGRNLETGRERPGFCPDLMVCPESR